MAERKKIGIIYSYDEGWIAGAYYISNLIHSLKILQDDFRPQLVIISYSQKDFDNLLSSTAYPYLEFHQLYKEDVWGSNYNLAERILNKVWKIVSGKNFITRNHTYKRLKADIDMIFPADDHIYFSTVKKKLYWIPDFQEHFLPQFFSEKAISDRKTYQKKLVDNSESIVFSSINALNNFNEIYPQSRSKTFVLQFAVTHSQFKDININVLKEKFKISASYFFCPNQFWAHKNHMVVLKAVNHLKQKGITDFHLVFSGKESDPRNIGYVESLKEYIKVNKIDDQVIFLGFIDRAEQLQIMNNAICVIQPSLFEGWSTVIEDAKAMDQFVIASDIEVHKEQLTQNGAFFDPHEHIALAEFMEKYIVTPPLKIEIEYNDQIEKFGRTFIDIVKQM